MTSASEVTRLHAVPAARLLVVLGLPGSGKSTLCEQLAAKLSYEFIETDRCWTEIFPVPTYSREESLATFRYVTELTRGRLSKGRNVIVEGVLASPQRLHVLEGVAHSAGATSHFFGLRCDFRTAMERMRVRKRRTGKAIVPEILWKSLASKFSAGSPQQVAVHWLDAANRTPEDMAATVLRALGQY